jgi:hypothetical protein
MSSERIPVDVALSCPMPLACTDRILLGHGSGGEMTAELIARVFLPAFQNSYLDRLDDQAVLNVAGERLAFTTDAHVITPLFFPGGDIGSLAVNGTDRRKRELGGGDGASLAAGIVWSNPLARRGEARAA